MIVDIKNIFNNNVFTLSENIEYQTIDISLSKITIIENFYQDIDLVLNELEKLPMTLVHPNNISEENNSIFIDARKCYSSNMIGTEIPYVEILPSLVSKIIKYPSENISVDKRLLINCYKFTDKFKKKYNNFYYNIHTDDFSYQHQPGQIAIVLFLNKYYENGEGMNFYEYPDDDSLLGNIFIPKNSIKISHFVQAKSNSAVLFDSRMLHGQFSSTDQFMREFRYTQVIFCPILK